MAPIVLLHLAWAMGIDKRSKGLGSVCATRVHRAETSNMIQISRFVHLCREYTVRYVLVVSSHAHAPTTMLEKDLLHQLRQWLQAHTATTTQPAAAGKQQLAQASARALLRTALTRAGLSHCAASHSTCVRLCETALLSGIPGAVSDAWQHVVLTLGSKLFNGGKCSRSDRDTLRIRAGSLGCMSVSALGWDVAGVAARLLVLLWPHLDEAAQAATRVLLLGQALPGA